MPNKLLTETKKNEINQFIIDSRISTISFIDFVSGAYNSRDEKLILKCEIHGIWKSTSFRSFISRGCRCPYCSGVGKYTYEKAYESVINKINISKSTLKFLGFESWSDKIPKNNLCVFECTHGHLWNTCRLSDFINKLSGSCGICSGGKDLEPLVEENIISKLIRDNDIDVSFVGFDSWNGSNTKLILNCDSHGTWNTTTLSAFKRQKNGCPKCAQFGYSASKAGYFYLQNLTLTNGTNFLKFGITNRQPTIRMAEQMRHSLCKHELLNTWYFDDGSIPVMLEDEIKKKINCGILSSDILKNGFTETTSFNNLPIIMDTVEKYLRK